MRGHQSGGHHAVLHALQGRMGDRAMDKLRLRRLCEEERPDAMVRYQCGPEKVRGHSGVNRDYAAAIRPL